MSEQFDSRSERASTLVVKRGLFLLRYVSSPSVDNFPLAMVRQAVDSESRVQLFGAPGVSPGLLAGPGACIVVVAETQGRLDVSVRRRSETGTLDAVLQLEPLSAWNEAISASVATERTRPALSLIRDDRTAAPMQGAFSILAHISRRGDVEVRESEWAAGPTEPGSIEGLQITLADPLGPQIEIRTLLPGPQGGWTPWAPPGTFVGSRGRALPLVGLRARVTGQTAENAELCAEALFLGSAAVKKRGEEIELVGPFGADPLVGLRLWVEVKSVRNASVSAPTVYEDRTAVTKSEPSRVRVLRVGGVRAQA